MVEGERRSRLLLRLRGPCNDFPDSENVPYSDSPRRRGRDRRTVVRGEEKGRGGAENSGEKVEWG